MKAIVYTEYGPPEVLHVKEVAKPVPNNNELLIRVYATAVNFGDLIARRFNTVTPRSFFMPAPLWLAARLSFGLRKPRKGILGNEFAGVVEAVGEDVTLFKAGDEVFGYTGQNMGAYAEYLCMPEGNLITQKPANLSFAEAATIPGGGITALNLLQTVNIQPGDKVLINGASGGIGSAAMQLAKHYGAEVTGVCGTPRMGFVKALGADHVIDYTKEDFTKLGKQYDVILDVLGKQTFENVKGVMGENGRFLLASFKSKQLLQMLVTSFVGSKKVICAMSIEKPENLMTIKELVEARKYKSIVDRCFPMEQAADAHSYVEHGSKKGNVVIVLK